MSKPGTAQSLRRTLLGIAAKVVLTTAYGFALFVCALLPSARANNRRKQTAIAIGTFHNPNWFYAHIVPLARSELDELILIGDGFVGNVEGVTVRCPSPILAKLLTRAGAKAALAFWIALRKRPSLYIGYAIFPAATTALVLGRLLRGQTCFQLTSGPLELAGGGYRAENRMLSSLGSRSSWIERLAHGLTRRFDLIVVRGSRAARYLTDLRFSGQVQTITGSIDVPDDVPPVQQRRTDLVFVGRFTERKRPERFIELVQLVKAEHPGITARMLGDGPDLPEIREQIRAGGLENNVELLGLRDDVEHILRDARVFVLTSRWEGVSIAMMEAMANGCVPVANDVGDLADLVTTGENGYLVDDDDIQSAARLTVQLLHNPPLLEKLSAHARDAAISLAGRDAVTQRWNAALQALRQ